MCGAHKGGTFACDTPSKTSYVLYAMAPHGPSQANAKTINTACNPLLSQSQQYAASYLVRATASTNPKIKTPSTGVCVCVCVRVCVCACVRLLVGERKRERGGHS